MEVSTLRIEHRGGWTARPGVTPRTSGGILVFEDLHRLDRGNLNRHQAILMTILEDAKIAPSKAAAASFEARVALHLNANPRAVLGSDEAQPEGPLARFQELNIPYDVASRIDVILPIHGSDDAAAEVEMVARDSEAAPLRDERDVLDAGPAPLCREEADQARIAQVRLLLARL